MKKVFSIISIIVLLCSILFFISVVIFSNINGYKPIKNFTNSLAEKDFLDIFGGSLSLTYENGENILPINNIISDKDYIKTNICLNDDNKRLVNNVEVSNYNQISANLLSYLKPINEGNGYNIDGGFGFQMKFNNLSEELNNECLPINNIVKSMMNCDLLFYYDKLNIDDQTIYSFVNLDHSNLTVYEYDENLNENIIIEVSGNDIWKAISENNFSLLLKENNGYLFGKKGNIHLRLILSQVYYFSETQTVCEKFSSRCAIINANCGDYENNILLCEKNLNEIYYSQVSLLNLDISKFYISRETRIKIPDTLKIGIKLPRSYYIANAEYEVNYFDITQNKYVPVISGLINHYEQVIEVDTTSLVTGQYRITIKLKYSISANTIEKDSIENYDYYFMIGDDSDVIK